MELKGWKMDAAQAVTYFERKVKPKQIIEWIEDHPKFWVQTSSLNGTDLEEYIQNFNRNMVRKFGRECRDNVDAYLIPFDIESIYEAKICDGFAYKSTGFRVVISKDTDIFSVLRHELCHLIIYSLIPESISFSTLKLERLVEEVEVLLTDDNYSGDIYSKNNSSIVLYLRNKYCQYDSP